MQLFPAYVLVGTSLVGFQATAFVTPSLVRHGRVSNPLFSMSTDETRNNVAPEKDLFPEAPTDNNPWTQNLFVVWLATFLTHVLYFVSQVCALVLPLTTTPQVRLAEGIYIYCIH